VRLKPARRFRARLRRGQHIRLRVVVNDPAHNRATKVVRVRLR
jgi:hypothetical protein